MWRNSNILKYSAVLAVVLKLKGSTKLNKKNTYTQLFIKKIVGEVQPILSHGYIIKKTANKLENIFINNMDIKGIGLYCLGSNRENLTREERYKYYDLFKNYFLKMYSLELAKYRDIQFNIQSERILNNNYTMVKGNIVLYGMKRLELECRVYTKNKSNPMLRDISIDGRSLAKIEKDIFISRIEDVGMEGVFKMLKV